jgi:hypothetical protein
MNLPIADINYLYYISFEMSKNKADAENEAAKEVEDTLTGGG